MGSNIDHIILYLPQSSTQYWLDEEGTLAIITFTGPSVPELRLLPLPTLGKEICCSLVTLQLGLTASPLPPQGILPWFLLLVSLVLDSKSRVAVSGWWRSSGYVLAIGKLEKQVSGISNLMAESGLCLPLGFTSWGDFPK